MAKKKEITVNPKNAPADVPTGDVVVLYGHTAIAALSEAGSIACQTEDTICEANIGIEYEPPAPATVTIPVYMQVGVAEPVYHSNITGIPGSAIDVSYAKPEGAVSYIETDWDNSDSVFFVADPEENDVFLNGYMPLIDTDHHYIIIMWTDS